VCAIAHVLEANGLTTISLSSVREFAENTKPPRALHAEFPIGRPLGKPNDPAYQRQVLDAAFELLNRIDGPVLEDFPDSIDDASGEPLACTVPPRVDDGSPPSVSEAKGLRKAYDRAVEKHGRTNVGRLADADGVTELIQTFETIAAGENWKEAGIAPRDLMDATKDILNYYEEAASALVDHTPAARASESWFYQETETGALMKKAQKALKDGGFPAWMYITPMTQQG
jgi:hypothetical protein